MEGNLIESIRLENELTLEMFDLSRPIAGDRWIVSFEARIEVEFKPQCFPPANMVKVPLDDIRSLLGEKAVYCYKKERHFVGEQEKDDVLNRLKERFMETGLGYLSSNIFPQRLILRRYEEASSKMNIKKTDSLKMRSHKAKGDY